jgi:hypothetical protein
MKRFLQGKYSPKFSKKYKGNPCEIYYRSSWERKFMVYCDKNENVKVKFFKTTLCSLILLAFYYVDIATDINLLIDYAAHKMWGYFTLTLLFILAPLLVQWIDTLISNRNKLRDYEIFLFVFWILLIPFYSIIL